MPEAALSLNGVGLKYTSAGVRTHYWALRNATFEVMKGETLGVVGRNGAGKSSLLRLLAGVYEPDEGTIERNELTASLIALQAGFVGHLSGRENALLGGMLMRSSRNQMLEFLPDIREFSDLGDFFLEPVRTYSSGMRARLAFAVSYFCDPDVILIDEVLGVGDREFREKSKIAMQEKIASNRTVVLASHQMGTIRELADRAIWIERGEVRALGAVETVLREYADSASTPKP